MTPERPEPARCLPVSPAVGHVSEIGFAPGGTIGERGLDGALVRNTLARFGIALAAEAPSIGSAPDRPHSLAPQPGRP